MLRFRTNGEDISNSDHVIYGTAHAYTLGRTLFTKTTSLAMSRLVRPPLILVRIMDIMLNYEAKCFLTEKQVAGNPLLSVANELRTISFKQ